MRVFVAGATGTLGQPVVRALVGRGHEVMGLTRNPDGAGRLQAMGVKAVIGNALDEDRMRALIGKGRPEVVVHLLTALPPGGVMRKSQLRPTNELRTTGTANLIAASVAARARRIVAESFVGVYGAGRHPQPIPEDDPLPPAPEGAFRDAVLALRSLEEQLRAATATAGIETVALRIGLLYGSAVPSTRVMIEQARAGRLFVPSGLPGIGPFVHNDDAAAAIVAAIEQPTVSPVYNIADDQPLTIADFIARLGATATTRPPRAIPGWVIRLMAPVIAEMGSASLPLDNRKAKRELGWTLRYPTVGDGMAEVNALRNAA